MPTGLVLLCCILNYTGATASPTPWSSHFRTVWLQAFQPRLRQAARKHPAALFLTMTMQPGEAAAAAAGSVLDGAAAADGTGPGSVSERVELMQGLGITHLPCSLLLRGDQLLARLEVSGVGTTSPAAAAAAAVRQLEVAVVQALRLAGRRSSAVAAAAGSAVAAPAAGHAIRK